MKRIFWLLLFAVIPAMGIAQMNFSDTWGGYMVTDSIKYEMLSLENVGDIFCKHDWCEGERPLSNSVPAIAYTPGSVMWWMINKTDKICRKCKRWEVWGNHYYQHFQSTRTPELDSLKNDIEKQRIAK